MDRFVERKKEYGSRSLLGDVSLVESAKESRGDTRNSMYWETRSLKERDDGLGMVYLNVCYLRPKGE